MLKNWIKSKWDSSAFKINKYVNIQDLQAYERLSFRIWKPLSKINSWIFNGYVFWHAFVIRIIIYFVVINYDGPGGSSIKIKLQLIKGTADERRKIAVKYLIELQLFYSFVEYEWGPTGLILKIACFQ